MFDRASQQHFGRPAMIRGFGFVGARELQFAALHAIDLQQRNWNQQLQHALSTTTAH